MSICPVCEETFKVGKLFGYREDDKFIHTCKECYVALMNIMLLQKLGRYKTGDARKLLKQELQRLN